MLWPDVRQLLMFLSCALPGLSLSPGALAQLGMSGGAAAAAAAAGRMGMGGMGPGGHSVLLVSNLNPEVSLIQS